MRNIAIVTLALLGAPAFAASGPFFSLHNTNFVVTLAFIGFVALLVYLKVPAKITGMLDDRAASVQAELNQARSLREEAQSILADYERKHKEVEAQSEQIVQNAKIEAEVAAAQARADLEATVARRMQVAEDQIASAQAAAIKDVRDMAITVAIGAAHDVIAKELSAKEANALLDDAITKAGSKLH